MTYRFEVPSALDYFRSLVSGPGTVPLFEAAASLAQDEYPDLDMVELFTDLDRLKAKLHKRAGREQDQVKRVTLINAFFYEEMGFAGNVNDYYDPDNSFVHRVMHTRRGIPISLAVIWIELAKELELQADGVNFPGHFLMTVNLTSLGQGRVVVDPFTGDCLSREDILHRIHNVSTPGQRQSRKHPDELLAIYLQPVNEREILWRMLRNLEEIYRTRGDSGRLQKIHARIDIMRDTAEQG